MSARWLAVGTALCPCRLSAYPLFSQQGHAGSFLDLDVLCPPHTRHLLAGGLFGCEQASLNVDVEIQNYTVMSTIPPSIVRFRAFIRRFCVPKACCGLRKGRGGRKATTENFISPGAETNGAESRRRIWENTRAPGAEGGRRGENVPRGALLRLRVSHRLNSWLFPGAWAQQLTGVSYLFVR